MSIYVSILLMNSQKRKQDIFRARRVATERIKRANSLEHPLIGVEREVDAQPRSRSVMFEQQGKAYASQVQRRELHKFWSLRDTPEYELWFLQRSSRSGLMVAGKRFSLDESNLVNDYLHDKGSMIGGESIIS